MAVCGRCFICGYKFNGKCDDGTEPDASVRWACESEFCKDHRIRALHNWDEIYEHKICTRCHDVLAGDAVNDAIEDLVALVARRTTDCQSPSTPPPVGDLRRFAQDCLTAYQGFASNADGAVSVALEKRAAELGLDVDAWLR